MLMNTGPAPVSSPYLVTAGARCPAISLSTSAVCRDSRVENLLCRVGWLRICGFNSISEASELADHLRGAPLLGFFGDCWASFFSERALFYRARMGSLDDLDMAVVIQRMVRADVAGVLFTCDPVHHRHDRMIVEAVLGLGEGSAQTGLTRTSYKDGTGSRQFRHGKARQPQAGTPCPAKRRE